MIDKHAVVASSKIAHDVEIGPYAIIGEDVEIGEGSWVGAHAVVGGKTKIGKNNKIFSFACVGCLPQDKKYHGEDTTLEVGDNNIFREFCTISLGTVQGGGVTKIGSDNLFMNYVHIAHDCIVGNGIVFSNNATLAGHVIVGDYAVLGGFSKIAQFIRIGAYSFLAGGSDIAKDILPYVIAAGTVDTARLCGLNLVGLKRHNFSENTLRYFKDAYNIILRKNLTVAQALFELESILSKCPEVQLFIDVLKQSERGIMRSKIEARI